MKTADLTPIYQAPGPFASVMLDVSQDTEHGRHEHELRVRAARESLVGQGADPQVVDAVAERLSETVGRAAPVARFVVAGSSGVLFDEVAGTRVDTPVVTWGALPDLAPWVAHRDAVLPFVLALVDHEGGYVGVYDSDTPRPVEETEVQGETEHVHKAPTADWSEYHHQHGTENVWKENAEQVAEEILTHVRAGQHLLLLAGDAQSRPHVIDKLQGAPVEVVELDSGSRAKDGGDAALREAVREALTDQVVRRRLQLSHALKDRLGRDFAVATGARDVAEAFVRGQVETLLLDPPEAAELTVDVSKHPGLAVGAEQPQEPVPADQALIAAAVLTGADVAVSPKATLGGAPVAALLRWDQDSVGATS